MNIDSKPYVLTTVPELPDYTVVLHRSHPFYERKPNDLFLNDATLEANAHRLQDATDALRWGEWHVWVLHGE